MHYPVRTRRTAQTFVREMWGERGRAMHYPASGTHWYVLGYVDGDRLLKRGVGDSWQAAYADYEKHKAAPWS